MFMPTAGEPPITTITDDQRQALREFFRNCVESERFNSIDPLMFALVLSGDKPVTTIDPSDDQFPGHRWSPQTGLKELCSRVNAVAYKRRDIGWWFVAPTYGRLDLLPSHNRTECNEAWMRRLGVIFGYPPSVIDYFLSVESEWIKPHERVAAGQFSAEEMADAGFVVYRHDDSVEGYEWAIKTGRRVCSRLEELADTWDVPELGTFVTEHRKYLRDKAIPEKTVQ